MLPDRHQIGNINTSQNPGIKVRGLQSEPQKVEVPSHALDIGYKIKQSTVEQADLPREKENKFTESIGTRDHLMQFRRP